jgi:putative intracellular protease/amidase/ketosteroid isomerase-like protein
MSKIVFALTSHAELGDTGRKTGYYVSEAAHPHAVLTAAGHEVDFVSVRGGAPRADGADPDDSVHTAFLKDHADALASTPAAADVDAARYSAILFVGGHGTMWDFRGQPDLQRIAREIYEGGGVVAAVCHGPAALVDLTLSDGSYLIAGKSVAAFTESEEQAVGLEDVVPFLLASTLASQGARHVPAPDFQANVQVDGRLITGQNPASATGVAEALVDALGSTSARALTVSYFAAEGRRDLAGVLQHFSEDVRFVDPRGTVLTGREAIEPFYAQNMRALPTLCVELVDAIEQGDRGALAWLAEGTNHDGATVLMRGTNLVTVRDGRFAEFHAYWGERD